MAFQSPSLYKTSLLDRILTWTEWLFESGVRLCSPLYIITAICLILTVAYVFFCIFLIEITPLEGSVVLLGHKAIAAWLLLNTLFNYYMCVVTNPGSTLDIAQSSLYNGYAQHNWRFCKTCDLPKPDLAHHCSICKKCVLRMDHHCPWIGNCVGYRNYRYFYLFLFYISIGCCYAFLMMNYYRHIFLNRKEHTFLPTFCYILCAAIGIAVGNLLLWHTFLIATGQGTIDCLDNFKKWKDAFKEGRKWRNPYSQGFINNFKSVFDVDGNFWWFLWTMPNITPKKGTGLFSITHQLDNYP